MGEASSVPHDEVPLEPHRLHGQGRAPPPTCGRSFGPHLGAWSRGPFGELEAGGLASSHEPFQGALGRPEGDPLAVPTLAVLAGLGVDLAGCVRAEAEAAMLPGVQRVKDRVYLFGLDRYGPTGWEAAPGPRWTGLDEEDGPSCRVRVEPPEHAKGLTSSVAIGSGKRAHGPPVEGDRVAQVSHDHGGSGVKADAGEGRHRETARSAGAPRIPRVSGT